MRELEKASRLCGEWGCRRGAFPLKTGPNGKEDRETFGKPFNTGPAIEKLKRFSPEIFFDLFLTLLGAIITAVSLTYGFGTFRRPGPGLYPFFIGLFLVVFGIILFVSEIKPKARPALFGRQGRQTFLLMVAVFCLWILMMPLLGYVVVTLLATYAFCRIMKLEGWWKPISVSAGTALFIYLLFDYWLYIDLPRGFWG